MALRLLYPFDLLPVDPCLPPRPPLVPLEPVLHPGVPDTLVRLPGAHGSPASPGEAPDGFVRGLEAEVDVPAAEPDPARGADIGDTHGWWMPEHILEHL